ncbi:hypothetical protein [Conexibacter woesei]|uniref:Uncharacterized protein n=1 Tax=Conexibacter woesei (strain DSM 14684 / CCUG 47730 / CIP 108061 / JCM 11494 / NBRC 100937 / ID131577) TaxID=469383 RepID=D3F765_CONWI|nr:hypothetical protein [Conexibacter woesei]ADB48836.1 hypothetical protein Cwoe_0400 [Conexibacter woesei DSM 14684]
MEDPVTRKDDALEQQQVAKVTRAIRALDTPAPPRLRRAVEAAAAGAEAAHGAGSAGGDDAGRAHALRDRFGALGRLRPRTRLAAGGALAAALALVVALVLVLPSGSGSGAAPTVTDVAAVTLRAPTQPAPAVQPGGTLDAQVQDVAFPDWWSSSRAPGPAGEAWKATGARSDSVGDRSVETVFYDGARGQRVGYAIADGKRLPVGGGRYEQRRGVHMWVYDTGGETAVMWYRGDRTCVVSGRGVDTETLLTLASSEAV